MKARLADDLSSVVLSNEGRGASVYQWSQLTICKSGTDVSLWVDGKEFERRSTAE